MLYKLQKIESTTKYFRVVASLLCTINNDQISWIKYARINKQDGRLVKREIHCVEVRNIVNK